MSSHEQKWKIQEVLCEIVEKSGVNGIDVENDLSLYRKVQQIGNTTNETEKIILETFDYLGKNNFVKMVKNNDRIVYIVNNKGLTLAKIQEYFD